MAMRILAITFLLWCCTAVAHADQHPAVCEISTRDHDGGQSHGSGVLVVSDSGRGLVLTAKHILKDSANRNPRCVFQSSEGTLITVEGFRISPGPGDVAAISIRASDLQQIEAMPIWPLEIKAGMPAYVEGFGNGQFRRVQGRVRQNSGESLTVTTGTVPGDSGGPIYTVGGNGVAYFLSVVGSSDWADERGRVQRPTETWGVPTNAIIAWLRDEQIKTYPCGIVSGMPLRALKAFRGAHAQRPFGAFSRGMT